MNKKIVYFAVILLVGLSAFNFIYSSSSLKNVSALLLANVEALTAESDWIDGYVTGSITVGKNTVSCCVSSVSTNSCNYGEIGCASANNDD